MGSTGNGVAIFGVPLGHLRGARGRRNVWRCWNGEVSRSGSNAGTVMNELWVVLGFAFLVLSPCVVANYFGLRDEAAARGEDPRVTDSRPSIRMERSEDRPPPLRPRWHRVD